MESVNITLPAGIELNNMERQSTIPESPVSPRGGNRTVNKVRVWRSACIEIDREFVVFMSSYFVLTGLLTFFCVGLYKAESCEQSNLYQSLLLLILGVILPSPRMNRR